MSTGGRMNPSLAENERFDPSHPFRTRRVVRTILIICLRATMRASQ